MLQKSRTWLGTRILRWYERNGRDLPWRKNNNPYRVWISEVMLQQTRVDTVVPYFKRWMKRFPNLKSLALSTDDEVLIAWEGLGYYRRAHNLLKAARIIQQVYGGKFPRNIKSLRSLPGLGSYSSAAIASIAFNQDYPVIDGNIRRVYSRLFDIRAPMTSALFDSRLRTLVEKNLVRGRAGDFNQALMDFGATVCTPKQPSCDICPLKDKCLAFKRGVQSLRPCVVRAKPIPHTKLTMAIIIKKHGRIRKVLLKKRDSTGLLAGLWEFPGFRVGRNRGQDLAKKVSSTLKVKVRKEGLFTTVNHAYTHFRVTVSAYSFSYVNGKIAKNFQWVRLRELSRYPMGKVNRLIVGRLALNHYER